MKIIWVSVGDSGAVDVAAVERACTGPGVFCVSFANHETGVVQAVAGLAEVAKAAGMYVHCDAVQAVGKVEIVPDELGVDTLAISGHKFGAAQGVGALWVRPGIELPGVVVGGHQERGRRAGTENLLGIASMGAAARHRMTSRGAMERVIAMTQQLEAGLCGIPSSHIYGKGRARIGNTVCVGFVGARGEIVVQGLDLEGVSVSTGAACTSGNLEPSAVVLGMGVEEARALEVVRFSTGPGTTVAEVERTVALTTEIVTRTRQFS